VAPVGAVGSAVTAARPDPGGPSPVAGNRVAALTEAPIVPPSASLRQGNRVQPLPVVYSWWRRGRSPSDGELPGRTPWARAPRATRALPYVNIVVRAPKMPQLVSITTGQHLPSQQPYREIIALPSAKALGIAAVSGLGHPVFMDWAGPRRQKIIFRLRTTRLEQHVLVNAWWRSRGGISNRIWFFVVRRAGF
jgi:hypothetical protein